MGMGVCASVWRSLVTRRWCVSGDLEVNMCVCVCEVWLLFCGVKETIILSV